jgi:hypothetical protein
MTPPMPVDTLNLVRTLLAPGIHVAAGPAAMSPWLRAVIAVAGYLVTMGLSGVWVRFFVGPTRREHELEPRSGRFDSGMLIGKCENVLALTFILAGDPTAVGVIFAAKSFVRMEAIKKEPAYYLGGFLINIVWSVLMGYGLRALVVAR